jgi:uncharacterized protein
VVDFCLRRPWWPLASATALAAASGIYAAERFAIKTAINERISPHLPRAKRALQYMREFRQFGIIVVVDAPTPERAERAATDLALLTCPERFRAVSHPAGGKLFEQNGLLFLPTNEVARFTNGAQDKGLLATLVEHPSRRGILAGMSMVLVGVTRGIVGFDGWPGPRWRSAACGFRTIRAPRAWAS